MVQRAEGLEKVDDGGATNFASSIDGTPHGANRVRWCRIGNRHGESDSHLAHERVWIGWRADLDPSEPTAKSIGNLTQLGLIVRVQRAYQTPRWLRCMLVGCHILTRLREHHVEWTQWIGDIGTARQNGRLSGENRKQRPKDLIDRASIEFIDDRRLVEVP
ncbi:hypothetical protein X946_5525 [Burkholderia sp. ABCPW 111]|nr:hypothetical protein X946_5525 [Burkholderia sp. ABCPW 111]